jgi:twitching motility protein PilT
MLNRPRSPLTAENRALLERIRQKQWKTPAERDALLREVSSIQSLSPDDASALLVDPDPAVRSAGMAILDSLPKDSVGASLLATLLKQPEAAQKKSFETYVASTGGELTAERFGDLVSDRRPQIIALALDWAGEHPHPRFLPMLSLPLSSGAPNSLRRKALAIAERIGTPAAAKTAAVAAEDEDEEVRFRAISLISRFATDEYLRILLKATVDPAARIAQAAAQGAKPVLTGGTWQPYVIPLLADTNSRIRENVLQMLKQQDPALVAHAFASEFANVFGPLRERGIVAFKSLGDPFLLALAEIADDPTREKSMATFAATLAVSVRSPRVVPLCIRLLKEQDWWLRHRASEALSEIKDERGLAPLIEMLSDRESDLTAAAALGAWGTPKALPGLVDAYKKGAMDLRLEILEAFAKIPDPRVPPLLQNITKVDPDPIVREKAVATLRALQGHERVEEAAEGQKHAKVDFKALPEVTLADLLRHARAVEASDVHLAVNAVPHLRIHGEMVPLPIPPLTPEATERMIFPILTEGQRAALIEHRSFDFCYKAGPLGRYRTNFFFQRKGLDAVFRLIPTEVPTVEELNLPQSTWELTEYSQGLVLVTGPSGCGKTTTLAAFIDRINRSEACHIITVEDPIEYIHRNRESLVNQREVGTHTESFAKALRQSLREDPDVIMVGEMRDLETISLAITAAETGHLVFGTLHTATAAGTIDRVIDAFPAGQQSHVRQMLADSLKAVIAQTLLPRKDGRGRVAAFEILRNTPNLAGLIREAKGHQIPSAIQTGSSAGMQTMDTAMLKLVTDGAADPRAAYDRAVRKEAFEPYLESEAVS